MRTLTSLVFVLSFAGAVFCQESHIQKRYSTDIDRTSVEADALYVVNMPSQFMSIRLLATYPKQGPPAQPPDRVMVVFSSFAPKQLYEDELFHRLQVKVDDQVLDFGVLRYARRDEISQSKEGEKQTNPDVRAALPSVALVRSTSKSTGLTMEMMAVKNATPADVATLAKAQSVIVKIGNTVFPLTPTHMSILREFVAAITPAEATAATKPAPPAEPVVPADVPSDQNQASLEQTLKWIKTEIEREGGEDNFAVPRKIEPLDFKTCGVRYRLVPARRTSDLSDKFVYAIMEYRLNLGELSSERVKASKFGTQATLFVSAQDQSKIKVISHRNESGTMGSTVDEGETGFVLVYLKSIDAAARLKVALTHAINLCHAQR